MSPRNFARIFQQEFGFTPAVFVDRLRLETARKLVEESDRSLDEIAADCGLGSADRMRRAFKKHFGQTPATMR